VTPAAATASANIDSPVQHDDEIGAALQRQPIAGLLVPAITLVAVMAEHKEVVPACHLDRLVG
jgi:hypothetical protein